MRGARVAEDGDEDGGDVRDLFGDRAGERPEARAARVSEAGLGRLELKGTVRLARLLNDEPELRPPERDVAGRIRQQDPDAGDGRVGLPARRATEVGAEARPASRT